MLTHECEQTGESGVSNTTGFCFAPFGKDHSSASVGLDSTSRCLDILVTDAAR